MNRAIVSLVLALLFAFPSFAQEKPDIMRVGVSSVAPFVIEEKGGKLKGFDIELGKMLAAETGLKASFELREFKELLPALEKGEFDAVMSALSITSERELRFDFTHHYLDSGLSILIPADFESSAMQILQELASWTTFRFFAGFVFLTFMFGVLLYLVERGKPQIDDKVFPGLFQLIINWYQIAWIYSN